MIYYDAEVLKDHLPQSAQHRYLVYATFLELFSVEKSHILLLFK